MTELPTRHVGLRAHDVHTGIDSAQVDRTSGLIARDLHVTQQVGMAGALATAVKGLEIVSDVPALRTIAGEQIDIPPLVFDSVVETLAEIDFVRNVRRAHGAVVSFYENIPEDFDRLYERLGEVWEQREPGEIESALLYTVDDLSMGPRSVAELDVDPSALESVLALGEAAEAIRVAPVGGRNVAYSPFFAYENPEAVEVALSTADIDAVRGSVEAVRRYQGLPVSTSTDVETLTGLVGAGLVAGPSVLRPDGTTEAFAVAPYGVGRELLTTRKPVLDKALAILAAVRMGEHFGGVTSLFAPIALLRALREGRVVGPHSSSRRQYAVLHRLSIVRFIGSPNGRTSIQLVDTADNREAVDLAVELMSHGEAMESRESRVTPSQLLLPRGRYVPPVRAIRPARRRYVFPDIVLEELQESLLRARPAD